KTVRDDREALRAALASGRPVVASVAPSFPAYFGLQTFDQMEAALRSLGFAAAGETAFGAEMVGLAHREMVDAERERWPIITSSCPVVVNVLEKYHPDLLHHLAPIVSPMIAHGRWLREQHSPEAYLVFIGPCIAKKAEIAEPAVAGVIDAALTFPELQEMLDEAGVPWPTSAPMEEPATRAAARTFPVEGGLVGTAKLETDMLSSHVVVASGLATCQDVLRGIRAGHLEACLVELMACEGGCINGPGMEGKVDVYTARQRVLAYAARRQPKPLPTRAEWPSLTRGYTDKLTPAPQFSEQQIQEMLRRVDKYSAEDELNCGACGYPTCREKAIATLRGMAEVTMCIPYMRRRAESLRQVVMDVTPNSVLVVDGHLRIQDMSPSAERLFQVALHSVRGRPLRSVMPVVDGFVQVRDTRAPVMAQVVRLSDDLVIEQTIVPVEGQDLFVAILRDITERERQTDELERIRSETLRRTQEVVNKQMRVAHEIAQLLGETTAETKVMVSKLAKLLEEGETQ
ncbi:MAG: PAS domain-containing protein, partial [Chloroflexi bacterium]|nr:PAS domain-containing protein [Chloroflexota bacterium]